MKRIASYPLTAIFYLCYGMVILFMNPIHWIAYNFFGKEAHHKTVKWLDYLLLKTTYILGTSYTSKGKENFPKDVPLIFVANHQSIFDIFPMDYYLNEFHPKFISKKELGKGKFSISYNLKVGGSALIDRNNPRQSVAEIKKVAEYIEENKQSVVIFPEGTRSKTGIPKPFMESGLKVLFKYAKSAYVVPVTINNSWEITKSGRFPLHLGKHLTFTYHPPIPIKNHTFEELFSKVEATITADIIQLQQLTNIINSDAIY